eukprot:11672428-Alexandrium_andersonii.AAC.1
MCIRDRAFAPPSQALPPLAAAPALWVSRLRGGTSVFRRELRREGPQVAPEVELEVREMQLHPRFALPHLLLA